MIFSGWLLPDAYEISCTAYEHILIVNRYLVKLKNVDLTLYDNLLYDWCKFRSHFNINAIDDLAVVLLGWVKVINTPFKYVFYNSKCNNFFEFSIDKYEKLGYTCIDYSTKVPIIRIPYKSKYLLK